MCITNDEQTWRFMSEYHDHGHDHIPNPGGRGGEGRSFVGFNFRMMELQGALGLAQLAKLDDMIARQKTNKAFLKNCAKALPGVSFREILDHEGDTATFLAFMLESAEKATAVNACLKEHGGGAISWGENCWHFYPQWENLLEGKTLCKNGWPFNANGKRRFYHDPQALPASAELMARTLCYPIPVNMAENDKERLLNALEKASRV